MDRIGRSKKKYGGNFKNIIVGSVKASNELIDAIKDFPVNIFESFGMTETATHIALKALNNFNKEGNDFSQDKSVFKTLPDIFVSQDERGCLVIQSPHLSKHPIVTNDIVKLYSDTDVVRNPIIKTIEDKFDEIEESMNKR